jgi:hypothetical protein
MTFFRWSLKAFLRADTLTAFLADCVIGMI